MYLTVSNNGTPILIAAFTVLEEKNGKKHKLYFNIQWIENLGIKSH